MLALHLFHRKPTSLTLVTESKAVAYVTISSLWNWASSHSFLPFRFPSLFYEVYPALKGICCCLVAQSCPTLLHIHELQPPRLLHQSIETDRETRFPWSPFSIWKKRKMSLFPNNLLQRNSPYLPIQYQSFFFFSYFWFKFGKIVYSNLFHKYCITLAPYFGMQEEIPCFFPPQFFWATAKTVTERIPC